SKWFALRVQMPFLGWPGLSLRSPGPRASPGLRRLSPGHPPEPGASLVRLELLDYPENLRRASASLFGAVALARIDSLDVNTFMNQHGESIMGFLRAFAMEGIPIDLDDHRDPVFDDDEIWLNALVLSSAADEN